MNNKGFTLIEILIVIVLVALLSAVAIPTFSRIFTVTIEEFNSEFSGILREARDRALLRGSVVRVQINIDDQWYSVAEGPNSLLLPSEAELEKKSRDSKPADDKEKKSDPFRPLKEIISSKDGTKKIPSGLKISEIISPRFKRPSTEGLVDIYFFPHGVSEPIIFHVEDQEKNQSSITLNPITGKTKLEKGFKDANER